MITVKNISFSYGYEPVFEDVSFLVGRNDKAGLVGPNGAGKSTLFKLLTREELPSEGTIRIDGTLTIMPQEVKYDQALLEAATMYEYVDPEHLHSEAKIHEIFNGLELEWQKMSHDLSHLSGGQKTKLALTKAFLSEPEILLLDEPTNFLDAAGKKWVMQWIAAYPHTVLIVSHDLDLLDKHIQRVLFLNQHTKKIDTYTGNYTAFIKTKQQQDALLTRKVVNEQKHIKRMEAGLGNLRKLTSKKGVRQRVMQERKIVRLKDKLPELPKELSTFKAKFSEPIAIGRVPIRVQHLSKKYGNHTVLQDLSFELLRGERLALLGPNGVGKTTLIKLLTGTLEPDSGEVIRSESLSVGYYSQESTNFDDTLTIQDVVENTQMLARDKIYGFLKRFLFSVDRLNQKIGTLSGGEKTRLAIALIMLYPYNVLILDEPTTYLDVLSQRIILEALKAYTGTMLIVSHTEEFVKELQPSRALILPKQRITFWTSDLLDQVSIIESE
ncbi:MAG: ABC-F family ATP-binding cassette domain-containing protein [Candidatus Woesebacteria bacterium]